MEIEQQIESLLEQTVRPTLRTHGGDVRLEGCLDGVVTVALSGACAGCPSADLETRAFIEDTLRAALPEVRRVEVIHPVDRDLLDFARRLLRGDAPKTTEC